MLFKPFNFSFEIQELLQSCEIKFCFLLFTLRKAFIYFQINFFVNSGDSQSFQPFSNRNTLPMKGFNIYMYILEVDDDVLKNANENKKNKMSSKTFDIPLIKLF